MAFVLAELKPRAVFFWIRLNRGSIRFLSTRLIDLGIHFDGVLLFRSCNILSFLHSISSFGCRMCYSTLFIFNPPNVKNVHFVFVIFLLFNLKATKNFRTAKLNTNKLFIAGLNYSLRLKIVKLHFTDDFFFQY